MKIVKSSYEIEAVDGIDMLKKIEWHGVKCYQMKHKIDEEAKSYLAFAQRLIDNGHESVLEHRIVTVEVICDRGVSHEIVRHRIGSYSQESTRYCNYTQSRFDGDIKFIDIREQLERVLRAKGVSHGEISFVISEWQDSIRQAEKHYNKMIEYGCTPEFARSVLPNTLKTEIAITYNLRQWRHFFKLRAENKRAHPQLREITIPMLQDFKKLIPVVFDDIGEEW